MLELKTIEKLCDSINITKQAKSAIVQFHIEKHFGVLHQSGNNRKSVMDQLLARLTKKLDSADLSPPYGALPGSKNEKATKN